MSKPSILPALALSASLFAGLGLTAFATDNPQGMAAMGAAGETLDTALTDRVETLLRTDVGLAGGHFRVATRAGVVTLAGTVPDEQSLRRALDIASDVKGVLEVRSVMTIDPGK